MKTTIYILFVLNLNNQEVLIQFAVCAIIILCENTVSFLKQTTRNATSDRTEHLNPEINNKFCSNSGS